MAGKKGRSGRRGLSATEHVLRGTFRKDRHTLPVASSTGTDQALVARLGAGLGEAGRQFVVDQIVAGDEWDPRSLAFLRVAGEAADRLAAYRDAIARDGVISLGKRGKLTPHPLLRHERAASAALVAALRAIDFEPAAAEPAGAARWTGGRK